jgi:hypothetical protein
MNSHTRKLTIASALVVILATTLACSATPTALPATSPPTLPLTETSLPTQTPVPLYLQVTLTPVPDNETGDNPAYSVQAQIPSLQGSNDARVTNFNNEMNQLTQEEIARFKDNVRVTHPVAGSPGSAFDQSYAVLSPSGNLLSLKFDIYIYIDGAAHPTTHSRTVNYDLEAGADLSLGQLFLPGSNYLQVIANYCVAQLQARDIGFEAFASGADPISANYSSWNVTPDGLQINFDEYQVAAYAAGPQIVTVPYAELQSVVNPNGPLQAFLP